MAVIVASQSAETALKQVGVTFGSAKSARRRSTNVCGSDFWSDALQKGGEHKKEMSKPRRRD
jgi:hypothetical protein